jgi:predicted nucleic acid-binding protein
MASRSRRRQTQASAPLILDSGAVIALARGDQRVRGFVGRAVEMGSEVLVPSVVIAETVRGHGPRDAPVNRILAAIDSVLVTDEGAARTAGHLLGVAGTDQTIEALIVAGAIHVGGGRVLTSDPDDIRRLARGRPEVTVHRV